MSSIPPLPELEDDYLWDPERPADAAVAELEQELRPLRHEGRAPDFTNVEPQARTTSGAWWALLAAAAVGALVVGAQLAASREDVTTASTMSSVLPTSVAQPAATPMPAAAPIGWRLDVAGGAPTCDGTVVDGSTHLRPGIWLDTQDDARARLTLGTTGWAEVGPGVRLRITEAAAERKVVELERGAVEIDIDAPPESFELVTPLGRVVDLGCHYFVDLRPDRLTVEVTSGVVALRRGDAEVVIEAGERLVTTMDELGEPAPSEETPNRWGDDASPDPQAPVWSP